MKKAIIISLAIVSLASGWIFHRSELDFGRVLNDQGDGKLYNGEEFYNYIHYDESRFSENDIVMTYDLLNPFNTYCDDIVIRLDFKVFENIEETPALG